MDAALGGSSISWSLIQPEISTLTRACSYDRAGFGWSDAGPMPRTAGRVADELSVLLERAGVTPPFVLVGHSFGGLVMRIFAARHRPDVTGLVLVDPAHPEDWVTPAPKEQLKIERGIKLCRSGSTAARLGAARVVSGLVTLGLFGVARGLAKVVSRGDSRARTKACSHRSGSSHRKRAGPFASSGHKRSSSTRSAVRLPRSRRAPRKRSPPAQTDTTTSR